MPAIITLKKTLKKISQTIISKISGISAVTISEQAKEIKNRSGGEV